MSFALSPRIFGLACILASLWTAFTVLPSQAQSLGPPGTIWGGEHVRLEVMQKGVALEFDCATGAIAQSPVTNAQGSFRVTGIFTVERGGPVRKDNPDNGAPATYSGAISGDILKLTIMAGPQNESVGELGEYVLVRGSRGHVVKCR